jgi:DNA-binding transcriptional MerR regulator
MARPLTIGQLARTTGMAAKTIRYYEQVGVLPLPSRTAAGYRQYTEEGIERLLFVRRARALGLPLERLRGLTAALDGGGRGSLRPRLLDLLRTHRSSVQQKIGELALLQRQLDRVLRRLLTSGRRSPAGQCHCLETGNSEARRNGHGRTSTRL